MIATGTSGRRSLAQFVGLDERADIAVLVVTYQNGKDVDRIIGSLRREIGSLRVRVVVADNASKDDTVQRLRAHPDVVVVLTGGNLGYAAGINAAARAAGSVRARLILNPDLEVREGCITGLLDRMDLTRAAVVVPRIVDGHGYTYPSLRREPNLLGAFGDALFGSSFAGRPSLLSENIYSSDFYAQAQLVDWATGAALLVDSGVATDVGDWDESFFLYSEETDFFRRVRALGGEVWYEPRAVVQHEQGGSGSSIGLRKLLTVNRIRYVRKHHDRGYALAYRCVVVLHELLRSFQVAHRAILRTVVSEKSWEDLPKGD